MNNLTLSTDLEIETLIAEEQTRQEQHVELIASENFTTEAVMKAQGSILTNKYAEGYPDKRYYGGCEAVDKIEKLAISRACELFGSTFANVQPHSGSQANQGVYAALMHPGDTILGMKLDHGGHLTHGATVSSSGTVYKSVQYGIQDDGTIDMRQVRRMAIKHKPKLIVAGFSAYSGLVDWEAFRKIADEVNAYLMVDMAHVAGLIAAGVYPNPVPHAHVVTSTTHKTLGGPRGGLILTNDEAIAKKINFAIFPHIQGGPLMHVIAAKAVCFKQANTDDYKQYMKHVVVNAHIFATTFKQLGYDVVSNGTHNHMFTLDLRSANLTGKEAEKLLERANITCNKNTIPDDPQSPFVTSGIRLGTAAMTRKGADTAYFIELAKLMDTLFKNGDVESVKEIVIKDFARTKLVH